MRPPVAAGAGAPPLAASAASLECRPIMVKFVVLIGAAIMFAIIIGALVVFPLLEIRGFKIFRRRH